METPPEHTQPAHGPRQQGLLAWLSRLDTTKLVALIGVVTYGLGVATVSFYLEDNEIPDPDLGFFKAHYIYTGIGVLAFFVPAAVLVYICKANVFKKNLGLGQRACRIASGLAGLLVIAATYPLVLGVATSSLDLSQLPRGLELGVLSVSVVSLGVLAYHLHGSREPGDAWPFIAALIAAGLVLVYISLYSKDIYRLLPDQYGGGRPNQARMLFSSTGAKKAQELGIPLRPRTHLSEPVTLILTSDTFYALRPHPEGHIVQIAKEDVSGLEEDSTPPYAVDVQTRDRGMAQGLPQAGDQLILTFSEEMDPDSLITNWSGQSTPASIVDRGAPGKPDELHFLASDGSDLTHLGVVELQAGGYERIFRKGAHSVEVELSGRSVVVTLLAGATVGNHPTPVSRHDIMVWKPSDKATDEVGNPSRAEIAVEGSSEGSGRADIDF